MHFSRISPARACQVAAIFLLLCGVSAPAFADGLAASPNPVNFYYSGNPLSLEPITVAVTLGGEPVAVTGAAFTSNPKPSPIQPNQELFTREVAGTSIQVGVNRSALEGVTIGGPYVGTLKIDSGANSITIEVRLTLGDLSFTLNPTNLQFYAAPGDTLPRSQTITVNTFGTDSFTAGATMHNGTGWLSIVPTSGTTAPGSNSVVVTVDASGLGAGNYTGTVRVTIGSTERLANVALQVGGVGGLTFNPASLGFTYSTITQQLPAARTLAISSTSATQFSASPVSTGGWLKINGSTNSTGWGSLPSVVTVSVDPTLVGVGIHEGTIQVQANDNSFGTAQVTLVVDNSSSSVTVSPTSLAFSGLAPSPKAIAIATSAAGVTFTASSPEPWLTLSQYSGTAPATLYAYVNPAGLGESTYTAYIMLEFSGGATGSHQVYVSYSPSGGGGTTQTAALPSQVSFAMQKGQSAAPAPKQFVVTGIPGTTFDMTAETASGGNWLQAYTENTVPAKVTVQVNNSVAAALNAGQYSGTVAIVSSTGTVNVAVTLNVSEAPVLLPNPGAFALFYDPSSGGTPPPQIFSFTSSNPSQQLSFSAGSSAAWLQLYGASGSTPGGLSAVIRVNDLPPGASTAEITAVSGGGSSVVKIPVTVLVSQPQANVTVSPSSLAFTTTAGSLPAPLTLSVMGTANTTFSVSSSRDWLTLNPTSGFIPANVQVTANTAGLGLGTHTGIIAVTAGGTTVQVPVSVTIASVAPANLLMLTVGAFEYQLGGPLPANKNVLLDSDGSPLSFQIEVGSDRGWLSVSPLSGTTPRTLTVSVDPRGLEIGSYSGTITVTSPGAINSPQSRPVVLNITPGPLLNVSKTTLNFAFTTGGSVPSAQVLAVTSNDPNVQLPFAAQADQPWIAVQPATGSTPGNLSVTVNPAGLGTGTHNGWITITSSAVPGTSIPVAVQLAITTPLPTLTAIANAASYATGAAAPGEIVVLFGSSLGPQQLVAFELDSSGRVPTSLSNVRVLFNGAPAPLIYVSAGQVSAVVPYAFQGGAVWVDYLGAQSNALQVARAPARPGIFTLDASGSGPGAILNQDYSLNSGTNGAAPGSQVLIYLTGEGQTIPGGVDGHVNSDYNNLPRPVLDVAVRIGNQPATVHYAGAAPDMVSGVMQVNAEIPAGLSPGLFPVLVTVGTASSQAGVTVAVK